MLLVRFKSAFPASEPPQTETEEDPETGSGSVLLFRIIEDDDDGDKDKNNFNCNTGNSVNTKPETERNKWHEYLKGLMAYSERLQLAAINCNKMNYKLQ